MNTLNEVILQLRRAGYKNNFWGWSAVRRLPDLLEHDEKIERAISGFYDGGHALVVATNKRIMLVDAKFMSFKVEDIHYEMVAQVDHFLGVIFGRVSIFCLASRIDITSFSYDAVKKFAKFVDERVNSIRLNMRTWEQMMDLQEAQASNRAKQRKLAVPPLVSNRTAANTRSYPRRTLN